MSAVAQESCHHFHQFSGMHGVPWCWTVDIPVDLCPISGPIDANCAGGSVLGGKR